MTINIDENSGFCWGVVRALDFAELRLKELKTLYSLGEIIHNPIEIERLGNLGLKTITLNDLPGIKNASMLIRAHGEPPSTYTLAKNNNIEIIDATCPIVKKVQERVKYFFENGYQIIIYGKKEHAEIIGINGVCDNSAVVIKTEEEARNTKLEKKNVIFSQTTMDKDGFKKIVDILKERSENEKVENFLIKDTICKSVSDREDSLKDFAVKNDIIIFVSGKNSSNGKVLYEICKNNNSNTFFVEKSEELQEEWFKTAETVGITGATSTPRWILDQIKNDILLRFKQKN